MFILYHEEHLWLQNFVHRRVLEAAIFFVEGGTMETLMVSAGPDRPSLGKGRKRLLPVPSKLSGAGGGTLDNCCARKRHHGLHITEAFPTSAGTLGLSVLHGDGDSGHCEVCPAGWEPPGQLSPGLRPRGHLYST